MTPSALYSNLTSALLRQGNRYLLSCACGSAWRSGHNTDAMPSWAVDWSRDKGEKVLPIWNPRYRLYQAGGTHKGWFHTPSIEGYVLRLQGAVVDIVEALGPPPPMQDTDQVGNYLASLESFTGTTCGMGYGTPGRLEDAVHQFLFLDCEVGIFSDAGRYTRGATNSTVEGYYCEMGKQNVPLAIAIPRVSIHASGAMAHVGRQLFATGRGMLGLGPPNVERGDLVCVADLRFRLCFARPMM